MKTCDEYQSRLSAYLDGETGDEEHAIRTHVDGCDACRKVLDSLRQVAGRIRDAGEEEPATLVENIRNRVREQGLHFRRVRRVRSVRRVRGVRGFRGETLIPKLAAAAAILAALLWAGVFLGTTGNDAIRLSNLVPTGELSEIERRILSDEPPTEDDLLASILSGVSPR